MELALFDPEVYGGTVVTTNNRGQVIHWKPRNGKTTRCDDRCQGAHGKTCDCRCRGKNHGIYG